MAESVVETNEAVSGAATASELGVAQTYAAMNCKQHRGRLSSKRDPDPGSGPQEPIPVNEETAFYDTDFRDWIEEAIGQIDETTTPGL